MRKVALDGFLVDGIAKLLLAFDKESNVFYIKDVTIVVVVASTFQLFHVDYLKLEVSYLLFQLFLILVFRNRESRKSAWTGLLFQTLIHL